jgi:hypothetical protein
MKLHSNPDMPPSSLRADGSLSAEIPYYTVFRFTATLDIPSKTAVNKQRRCIEGFTVFN